jgi:hypothetical protein
LHLIACFVTPQGQGEHLPRRVGVVSAWLLAERPNRPYISSA